MLLNNDLLFVAGSFIVGSIFTYSIYNYIFTTVNNGESLVNTLPNFDSINELPESTLPVMQPNILHKIDVGVQTSNIQVEAVPVAVQPGNLYIDVGVQTSSNSLFSKFKDWLLELISIRSSQIPTPAEVRIENWLDNLDSSQVVSTPTANSIVSVSNLQRVDPIFNESIALEYAKSQANLDIGSRAEYFNTISPQLDVDLHNIMVNDTQYMFAVINDVLLTIDPNIFNLFM